MKGENIRRNSVRDFVKGRVAELIKSSGLEAGDRIMSQNELAALLKADPMTVHKALTELSEEGLLYRVKGKGTFVAGTPVPDKKPPVAFINELTIDYMGHPYYGNLLGTLTRLANQSGYELISYYSPNLTTTLEHNPNPALRDAWLRKDFSAVILNIGTLSDLSSELIKGGIPYVASVNCAFASNEVFMENGLLPVFEHLARRGAKHIGVISLDGNINQTIENKFDHEARLRLDAMSLSFADIRPGDELNIFDAIVATDDFEALKHIMELLKFKDHSKVVIFANAAMSFPAQFSRVTIRPEAIAQALWELLCLQFSSGNNTVSSLMIKYEYDLK